MLIALILATWARAAGLTRDEADQLAGLLQTQRRPMTPGEAWDLMDRLTLEIRRNRAVRQPPVEQAPWIEGSGPTYEDPMWPPERQP